MIWNEFVGMRPAVVAHGSGTAADGGDLGLPRPRAARRVGPHREGGVVTRARQEGGSPGVLDGGHAAALVSTDEQLFAEAASYVQAGVDASDLVVIGGPPAFLQARAEDFGDAERVEFDDGVRLNSKRAPDVFSHLVGLSDRASGGGSGRLRVLAQVDYSSDPRATREFACFEAASNLVPTGGPTSVLCLYDTRRLAPELVRTAACTHSTMVEPGRTQASEEFVDPHDFVRGVPIPAEPLQD